METRSWQNDPTKPFFFLNYIQLYFGYFVLFSILYLFFEFYVNIIDLLIKSFQRAEIYGIYNISLSNLDEIYLTSNHPSYFTNPNQFIQIYIFNLCPINFVKKIEPILPTIDIRKWKSTCDRERLSSITRSNMAEAARRKSALTFLHDTAIVNYIHHLSFRAVHRLWNARNKLRWPCKHNRSTIVDGTIIRPWIDRPPFIETVTK